MKKDVIFMILLCILNSYLFFELEYGLNVILFTIPLILFLLYEFKNSKQIKNKKGLLFLIPIILLSCTYLVYDNLFQKLNIIIIPVLYVLMIIYTFKPTFNILQLIDRAVSLVIEPIGYISNFFKSLDIGKMLNLSENGKKKMKSILVALPLIVIVIMLLSSADMMFGNIFSIFNKYAGKISFENLVRRLVTIIILFTYMGVFLYYLFNEFSDKKENNYKNKIKVESYTIKVLLTSLNIIYIIFDIIQIKGLIFQQLPVGITYATYARRGFFQLVIISLINFLVILMSKFSEENKYNKIMSLIMILLTLIIIGSSFFRMYLYESAYGYTMLRLLVYVALITEVLMLIPTVVYILNSKMNIIKWYMIIIISVYSLINLTSFEYIIAKNNIDRYYDTGKIDIKYLENYNYDNIPLLIKIKDELKEQRDKMELERYFKELSTTKSYKNDFREYNISKNKSYHEMKKAFK